MSEILSCISLPRAKQYPSNSLFIASDLQIVVCNWYSGICNLCQPPCGERDGSVLMSICVTSVIFIHSRGQQINTDVQTHDQVSVTKTFAIPANIYFSLPRPFQRRIRSMELAIFSGPAFPVTLYGPTNDWFVSELCCCRGDCSNCGCRLCSPAE